MVTAFILINAERDRLSEIPQELLELPGVAEVYSVAGEYDLVAVARVKQNEELAQLVTGRLLRLPGIRKTNTLIAFQQYSKFDLERMFSVGM